MLTFQLTVFLLKHCEYTNPFEYQPGLQGFWWEIRWNFIKDHLYVTSHLSFTVFKILCLCWQLDYNIYYYRSLWVYPTCLLSFMDLSTYFIKFGKFSAIFSSDILSALSLGMPLMCMLTVWWCPLRSLKFCLLFSLFLFSV